MTFASAEKQAEQARELNNRRERIKLLKKAFKAYRKAADQGSRDAAFRVGECYRDGTGVEKDSTSALEWLQKAAKQGSPDAQLALLQKYTEDQRYDINTIENYLESMRNTAMNNPEPLKFLPGTRQRVLVGVPVDALGRDVMHVAETALKALRLKKTLDMEAIIEGYGLDGDFVSTFSETISPHITDSWIHNLALCFLHSSCGVPKNLQIAKDILEHASRDLKRVPPSVAEALAKLASCAQCGGEGTKLCSLCKVTRYCSKECQAKHWKSGDPPHRVECPRVVTPSCVVERPAFTYDATVTDVSQGLLLQVRPKKRAAQEAA